METVCEVIFLAIWLYNIIFVFWFTSANIEDNKRSEDKKRERTWIDKLMLVFVLLVILAVLLIFFKRIPRYIRVIIFTVPFICKNAKNSLTAAKAINKIIFGQEDDEWELTEKDLYDFEIIVTGLMLFNIFFPSTVILENIGKMQVTENVHFFLWSLYLFAFVFSVTFILFVHMIIPLRHFSKLCAWMTEKLGKIYKRIRAKLLFKEKGGIKFGCYLTNRLVFKTKEKSVIIKMVLLVPKIVMFFCDFVINILEYIYVYLIIELLGTILGLGRKIWNLFVLLLRKISMIPGRRVMKNSFRVSGIAAITYVVISNRLSLYISLQENILNIEEFIASAVIIPIILEWIFSGRQIKAK